MTREYERVTCPGCGRRISAYVPHMGNGTALRTVKHALVNPAKVRARTVECTVSRTLIQFNQYLGGWEVSL